MAESVDALVSNTSGETHPGSSPGLGTERADVNKSALLTSKTRASTYKRDNVTNREAPIYIIRYNKLKDYSQMFLKIRKKARKLPNYRLPD